MLKPLIRLCYLERPICFQQKFYFVKKIFANFVSSKKFSQIFSSRQQIFVTTFCPLKFFSFNIFIVKILANNLFRQNFSKKFISSKPLIRLHLHVYLKRPICFRQTLLRQKNVAFFLRQELVSSQFFFVKIFY